MPTHREDAAASLLGSAPRWGSRELKLIMQVLSRKAPSWHCPGSPPSGSRYFSSTTVSLRAPPSSSPAIRSPFLKQTQTPALEARRDPECFYSDPSAKHKVHAGPLFRLWLHSCRLMRLHPMGARPLNTHKNTSELSWCFYPNYEYITEICAHVGAFFTHG